MICIHACSHKKEEDDKMSWSSFCKNSFNMDIVRQVLCKTLILYIYINLTKMSHIGILKKIHQAAYSVSCRSVSKKVFPDSFLP